MNSGYAGYAPLISIAVIALILALRMRRLSRPRPLKTGLLWLAPGLLLVATGLALAFAPPAGLDWAWPVGGLALGCPLGWYRGKTMRINVDPENHALTTSASPAALAFIVGLVALRYGLRYLAVGEMQAWRLSAMTLTDAFMAFALGLVATQRLEMWLRSRRLLGEARAASATAALD